MSENLTKLNNGQFYFDDESKHLDHTDNLSAPIQFSFDPYSPKIVSSCYHKYYEDLQAQQTNLTKQMQSFVEKFKAKLS